MKKMTALAVALSFLTVGFAFAADKAAVEKECKAAAEKDKVAKDKLDEYLKKCMADKGVK